jgi:class 3 adenylate cyclase
MFRKSIRQKIVGIAAGLIVLAVITSLLSMVLAGRVGHLLDELTNRYIPAYAHLARVNVRSLERSLALRRMVMARMQTPPDETTYAAARKSYDEIDPVLAREAAAARQLINAIILDPDTPSDNAALGRIDDRIDHAINDLHKRLTEENAALLRQLEARDMAAVRQTMVQSDTLRDEFNVRIESIRSDMLAQVSSSAKTVLGAQDRTIVISAIVTAIAAVLGFVFAMLVGSGITRPVTRLLEGTREVEAGKLDGSIAITTQDEIGELSGAFNRMIETLRHNQKIRETFGRYINPRIAEGLLDQPAIAATEGQRRIMTVMFCDMKGFTSLSEGVTPRGLVKIMNLYLSTMSAPIHEHRGIIDKYIGDAVMAYWGPPFTGAEEQARLACMAALEQLAALPSFQAELPDLMGVRRGLPQVSIRVGIATGEVVVGSIGSEQTRSYTVIGDTVNFASRLEGAGKAYGTHVLISEATQRLAADAIETREIDTVLVVGKTEPERIFELLGRKGEVPAAKLELRDSFEAALVSYRAQAWEEAEAGFRKCLEIEPEDGPSGVFLARVAHFREHPPAPGWNGVWALETK